MRRLLPTLLIAAAVLAPTAAAARPAVPKKPNVVMIIMDEFPVDQMLDASGQIDPMRYPNFAALARSATWFKNATTTYDSTPRAVPEVMDGRLPRKASTPSYRGHPDSIYTMLGRRGYRVVNSEEATSVCPPRYCRGATSRPPDIRKMLAGGRPARFERFVQSIRPSRQPTLYLKHVLLPHLLYQFLPSGKQTRRTAPDPVLGMNSPAGYDEPFLTDHNQQLLLLQIGYADRELGRLVARMKKTGTYDSSAFVLTADHGISFQLAVDDRRKVSPSNIEEVAPVPMFVKAPGQRRGGTSAVYARTIDLVPTIADLLGFKMPYRADGRSVFSAAVRRRREVRMLTRDLRGSISISARSMEARRRAVVLRKLAKFGSGDIGSLYSGIGPNRQLLGRVAAEFQPTGLGAVRGEIVGASDMRAVDPRSDLLPTQVAGQFSAGTTADSRRDLAVAVNGVIRAVGRSFHLRRDVHESFALSVPETALRAGSNDVAVYEVSAGGQALQLVAHD